MDASKVGSYRLQPDGKGKRLTISLMPESIFQAYRNRLVDLTTKNRALYLPKTEGYGSFDLQELDFLAGEKSFEIIKKAISSSNILPLIPESDPRIASVNTISKTLSRLAFRDQLTREETGQQSLFLGWPFVEGKLMNGQVLRAPILLLGVDLHLQNSEWILLKNDTWQWNPAFLLAYSQGNDKVLSADYLNQSLKEFSTDATEFRVELSKLLHVHFSIQLNSSLFEDLLIQFPSSLLSLDSSGFQDGKLALKSYAVLRQFAQKDSFLYSEYQNLENDFGNISLEDLLARHFVGNQNQTIPREEQLFSVFPLDASQENILLKVRQGKSLVVEGPPGTGKSQLIANLVSDYCSRGKRVLVVSQKRAALDVVFERLSKVGFGDFLGLVHDFRGDQKVLFQKIKAQIEAIESYQEQNRGIDSIQLEREISKYSKTISRLSGKFEMLRTSLYEAESAGIPIKTMYLKASLKKPFFEYADLSKLNFQAAEDFQTSFKIFHAYQVQFKESFWDNRISFAHFEPAVFPRISQVLKEVEEFRSIKPNENLKFDFDHLVGLVLLRTDFLENLTELHLSLNKLDNSALAVMALTDFNILNKLVEIQEWDSMALEKLEALTLGISPSAENFSNLEIELELLEPKVLSWLGRIGLSFSKSKFPLTFKIIEAFNLTFDRELVSKIRLELETLKALNRGLEQLPPIDGMRFNELSIQGIRSQLDTLNPIIAWVLSCKKQESLGDLSSWDTRDFERQLSEVCSFLNSFQVSSTSWKTYLSDTQILRILKNGIAEFGTELQSNQIFSDLVAFDRLIDSLDPVTISLAHKLEQEFQGLGIEKQLETFWNSWYLAWIAHLESKTPVLAEAGSLTLQHELDELKTAILEKRKISRHMALLRLREQVTSGLEVNRLGNRLTYRELLHQVSKKRQRWSIRKLIGEMGEEVFRLLPCWFASPETVSALFSLSQEFDLVIFDEASQCQVERGLPAMLRGKQVVIAGDSKQLRPSGFYQVKLESEEDGLEFEAESLLELASNFYEKYQLKGHYRSADPALIHFSNTHFYDSHLETLPDYVTSMAGEPAFTWEKVQGIWSNQVNKTEADAVVLRVGSILMLFPADTIGIVTGNYFQMELIRERLWKAGFQDAKIKVRNIENVQGDEFDQVILSLGYAANPEGRLVTNFGLLGRSGAENRLNVAITRARKKMHVISSIDQEDFRPGQLKNPGLALVREFLIFVKEQASYPSILPPVSKFEDYELDWTLKNYLRDQNEAYSREVPSAVMDLILKQSTGENVAILTDDQRFFNAHTAKAALAYHPILLNQKGWNHQVRWSRNCIFI